MSEEVEQTGSAVPMQFIPGFDVLKKIQKVLEIVNAVKTADENGNGVPDWADLLQIAQEMLKLLNEFKDKVPGLTLASVMVEVQSFLAQMQKLYAEASKLMGDNVEAFKAQFPELIAQLEAEAKGEKPNE